MREGFESEGYEPESEEPVVDETAGAEFEDYDRTLETKTDSMTDQESDNYVEEFTTEDEDISNVTDSHTSLEDASSSLDDDQSMIAESPAIDESVDDGFESEAGVDADAEPAVDNTNSTSLIDGNLEPQNATDESVGDGLEDYIDDLDSATDESVEDEFVEYVDNLDSPTNESAVYESVDDGLESEAKIDTDAEPAVDNTNSSSLIDGNLEPQNATDESVGDGLEDYIDHLDSATDKSVEDEFGEYMDNLQSEIDSQLADATDSSSFAYGGTENATESQTAADDSFNEGTAPPITDGKAQTPNMQERVDLTENSNILSTDSTELDMLTPEDRDEVANSSSVPIDDLLVTELEELSDIPNEKELVDDYINNDVGSLEEFKSAESQSVIPEGLQTSVQETTHELTNGTSLDFPNTKPKDEADMQEDVGIHHDESDEVSSELGEEEGKTDEEDVDDDHTDIFGEGSEKETESEEIYRPSDSVSEGLQPSVQQTTHEIDTESGNDGEPGIPLDANSDTPLDTDTQKVTDSHQSNEVAYDNYDRESVNFPPNEPELEIESDDIGMSSDDSSGIPDADRLLLDEDAEDYSEGYEPPSEYSPDRYSDGPTLGDHFVEDLEEEVKEFEVNSL